MKYITATVPKEGYHRIKAGIENACQRGQALPPEFIQGEPWDNDLTMQISGSQKAISVAIGYLSATYHAHIKEIA